MPLMLVVVPRHSSTFGPTLGHQSLVVEASSQIQPPLERDRYQSHHYVYKQFIKGLFSGKFSI